MTSWKKSASPFQDCRPVAIDTDPGVDDALALILALRSPEISVELITTVAGNVPVRQATANARRLLAVIATNPPPLAMGSARPLERRLHTAEHMHGGDGLGGLTGLRDASGRPRFAQAGPPARRGAVERLVELARQRGPELTVIALGPLTNIAHAVQRAPRVMSAIGRLVVMGGAVDVPGNVTANAEFNLYVDPDAARRVIASGIRMTFVPLDVTRQVRLTRELLREHLGASRSRVAAVVRHVMRDLLASEHARNGFPLHDPLAVAVAIDPGLVRTESLPLTVEARGTDTRGMMVVDRRAAPSRGLSTARVDVATGVDADRALELFASRVLASGRPARRAAPPPRVVVLGSANTDFIVTSKRLPAPGETVLGEPLQTAFGGKGANQALAARRAGAEVEFIGMLGDDHAGERYASHLRAQGIGVRGLARADAPSGVALIAVDRRGQNQITVAPGANDALSPQHVRSVSALIRRARVLVAQLENPLPAVERGLREAKAGRVRTILNPAPARSLPRRFSELVDVLVPNESEASFLTGRSVTTPSSAKRAARHLHALGYAAVIITLGRRGAVWSDGTRAGHVQGVEVNARDATGAGDTFVGYLACALAEGRSLGQAVVTANAAAALSVTGEGAQPAIPSRRAVARLSRAD